MSEQGKLEVEEANRGARAIRSRPLTASQRRAWVDWSEPAWGPFVEAWLDRGFRLPPEGDPRDDPRTSLRSRLWEIADARPNDLGRWVREAKGRSVHDVVGHVFAKWQGLREELGPDDWDQFDAAKMASRYAGEVAARKTWTRLDDIVKGLPLGEPMPVGAGDER